MVPTTMQSETPLDANGQGQARTEQSGIIARIDKLMASTPDMPDHLSASSTPLQHNHFSAPSTPVPTQYNINMQPSHQPLQPHYYSHYPSNYASQPPHVYGHHAPPIPSTPIVPSTHVNHPSITPASVPQDQVESAQPARGKTKNARTQKAGNMQDAEGPPMPKKKAGGRPAGTQNWIDDDLAALTDIVGAVIPIGMKGWKTVEARYSEYATKNDRKVRDWDSIQRKCQKVSLLLYTKKCTYREAGS
jgi:hypothetical protein